jgi:hypothetical protein
MLEGGLGLGFLSLVVGYGAGSLAGSCRNGPSCEQRPLVAISGAVYGGLGGLFAGAFIGAIVGHRDEIVLDPAPK